MRPAEHAPWLTDVMVAPHTAPEAHIARLPRDDARLEREDLVGHLVAAVRVVMSAEVKALLGQVVFNDPKGFGAHAMEFGQFRARGTRELTQGCVARVF